MFTDEQKAKLRMLIDAEHEIGEIGSEEDTELVVFLRIHARGLLERLEAAEYIVSCVKGNDRVQELFGHALSSWEQSAGREGR